MKVQKYLNYDNNIAKYEHTNITDINENQYKFTLSNSTILLYL